MLDVVGRETRRRIRSQVDEQGKEEHRRWLRGWINYYGKSFKCPMIRTFNYLDYLIQRWMANKYKFTSKAKTVAEYKRIKEAMPEMYYHWKFGIKQD